MQRQELHPFFPQLIRGTDTTRNGQGKAMTRLQLSDTGHIVLGPIGPWGFLIFATVMMLGTAE